MADIKNHSTLTTSLVSYWDLEEASGKRYDLVGSNNLDDNNTVTQGTGKVGKCADFVATNSEYFTTASFSSSNSFSISFWVNPDRVNANEAICVKNDIGVNYDTTGAELRILMLSAGTIVYQVGNGSAWVGNTLAHGMSAGTWYHWVMTFDGSTITLYKNGSSHDSTSSTFTRHIASDALYIGIRNRQGATDIPFDGQLDEFAWWDKALSTDEITALYNSGSGLPYYDPADVKNDTTLSTSLVSYYEMEEATATTRTDSHGSNDLTNNSSGSGVTQVTGVHGTDYGADFNSASNEYLSTTTCFTTATERSFSFWFKPDSLTGTHFIAWTSTNSGTSNDTIGIYTSGDGVYVNENNAGGWLIKSGLSTGTWYHVVVLIDGTNGAVKGYVNGVLEDTETGRTISDGTGSSYIGIKNESGTPDTANDYDGAIDEFGVWSKLLSVAEVRALYGYGTPPVYDAGGINYPLTASVGTFTLTGIASLFNRTATLLTSVGTFTWTGISALFVTGKGFTANTGAFVLTGIDTVFSATLSLIASAGTFTLTGIDAVLSSARSLVASTGSFVLTGISALLRPSNIWSYITRNTATWTERTRNSTTWTRRNKS